MQANPLVLYGFFFLFLINPFKTLYYKSRFWLLKLLVRPSECRRSALSDVIWPQNMSEHVPVIMTGDRGKI
jgi:hypothetical protein